MRKIRARRRAGPAAGDPAESYSEPVDLPADRRRHRARAAGKRWDDHNSSRRTKILETAVALIEENEPGAEISVQQIAERAGLARSVVYRQFADRDDLDNHVRQYILERYVAAFDSLLVIDPDKTAIEIIVEFMRLVIGWAGDHPNMYYFGQTGAVHGHESGALGVAAFRSRVADTFWSKFTNWTAVLDIDVSAFRPIVFGLVSMVEGVVTEYIYAPKPDADADPEALAQMLGSSVWFVFEGHARELGYHFDRNANAAASLVELIGRAAKPAPESTS